MHTWYDIVFVFITPAAHNTAMSFTTTGNGHHNSKYDLTMRYTTLGI